MLHSAIVLDAAMPASEVLTRLARYGLWLDASRPPAKAWIEEQAKLLDLPLDETFRRLVRSPSSFGVAIRRQVNANVLWYPWPALDVLRMCEGANPQDTLQQILNLHEYQSIPPLRLPLSAEDPQHDGVVLEGDTPVAVSIIEDQVMAVPRGRRGGRARPKPSRRPGGPGGGGGVSGKPRPPRPPAGRGRVRTSRPSRPISRNGARRGGGKKRPVRVDREGAGLWPHLDAPQYVPASKPFEVTVGLSQAQQPEVKASKITLTVPAGTEAINLDVELIASGVDAPSGWTRKLHVTMRDPTAARVAFQLVGREPAGSEPHLTTLEVRYVLEGTVCGTASRSLIIGPASVAELAAYQLPGTPWLAQPDAYSPITLGDTGHAPDLTIELAKPDRNDAQGRYVCRLISPHPLKASKGPHDVDLGEDAKTFAKRLADHFRHHDNTKLVDNLVRSVGGLVAEKLPPDAFAALREVAQIVAPAAPAVLIVSAEPFVPWELAAVDPPLDPSRPPYLGAQALVGRWIRRPGSPASSPVATQQAAPSGPGIVEKPPAQPPASIDVRHMAVMAGKYMKRSGLSRLPGAEKEAEDLIGTYGAVALKASPDALSQLLNAQLMRGSVLIGGADAVHFAGHGNFDPKEPDGSVMFLNDGKELSSFLFRSANYGGKQQPFFFLNACMIGLGGELLGNMGGFPGNCLKGGFGALLGALWEVDDDVARKVAIEFWRRALSSKAGSAEPVGAVLRDLRAKYNGKTSLMATYLAYVYYGHPRLTLQRSATEAPAVGPSGKAVQQRKRARLRR